MRRALIIFAAVLGLSIGAVAAGYAWLQTDGGRGWLAGKIEALASTPGETELRLGAVTGNVFRNFGLSELRISDRSGVWLTAKSVEVAWNPWDLLGRAVSVDRLALRGVVIDRLPESEPSREETSLTEQLETLRDLPTIRISALSAEPISLGAAVLGQEARLKIEGGMEASGSDSLQGQLHILRLDGVPGEISLDARYGIDEETLSLDLTAMEPAGGLLARALEVPDHPELTAALKGDGPLSDWKGRFDMSFGTVVSSQATIAIRHGDETAFDVDGSARLPSGDADLVERFLSGEHKFRVDGSFGKGDVVTLSAVRLESVLATLEANGKVGLEDLSLDATATLTKTGAAPLTLTPSDVSVTSLSAKAVATGKLPLPEIEFDVTAGKVTVPGSGTGDVSARVAVVPANTERARITGDVTLTAFALGAEPDIAALIGEQLSAQVGADIDLAATSVVADNLKVTARHASLTGNGRFDWNAGDGAIKASLSMPDLSVLRNLATVSLTGGVALDADATLKDFGATVTASIQGKARNFTTGITVADGILAREVDLTATLSLSGDTLDAKKVSVNSGRATVTADTTLDLATDAIDGNLKAAIDGGDPIPLSDALALHCACDLDGTVAGFLNAMTVKGSLSAASVRQGETAVETIELGFDLAALPDAPAGTVTVSAKSPVGDLTARTGLAVQNDILKLDGIRAESRDATVTGTVALPLSGAPVRGDLNVEVGDLTGLLALAQLDGDGKLKATASLRDEAGRQAATAEATIENLSLRTAPDAPVMTAESTRLKLTARDLIAGDDNKIELRLEKGSVADLSLETLTARADGALDHLKLSAKAEGNFKGPMTLDTAADYRVTKETPSLTVTRLQGTLTGENLTLSEAMRLSWGEGEIAAAPVALTYGDATLSGHARSGTKGLDVSLTLSELPLSVVEPFWPLGVTGKLDATLSAKGAWPDPPGSFRVSAPALKFDQAPDTPALALDVDGAWKEQRLTVDGNMKAGDAPPSTFKASLPLRLDGPQLQVSLPPDRPVSGQLDWSGDVAALWRLSPLTEHLLRGDGEMKVGLSGTLAKPELRGSVALSDGYYESLEFGTVLKPMNLTVTFDGQEARITKLDAGDGGNGRITGTGKVDFDADAGFPFDLAMKLNALTAVRRDDVEATASGDIAIAGSTKQANVTSKLTTDRVEVRVLDRLPPDVVTLDVTEIGRSGQVIRKPEEADPLTNNIELAIDVEMPRRVFVRGRGIESEWRGNIKVTGPAGAPQIAGYVALVRGQVTVVGKTFRMESGNVVLPDTLDEEPSISLVATYASRNLTVRADVEGPVSKPTIKLSSVPELPQDEIVSQILFDKSSTRLTAVEAAQLAIAVAQLTGRGGGGFMDFARRTLGVDVLKVETVETADGTRPVVGAGKYITDDVYVGVKQGATPDSTSVGVEVEVTPNIFLESDVRRSGESDVGVKFKYDY